MNIFLYDSQILLIRKMVFCLQFPTVEEEAESLEA